MTDTLITVDNLSKRFCRSLKSSLWYGLQDLCGELQIGAHLRTSGVSKPFLRKHEFWALKDISFQLRQGECLGLIGRNGAGKSTLLRILNGLIKPDSGSVQVRGKLSALIALGAGFNPILTGRENIMISASVLGTSPSLVSKILDDIIDFSGVGKFIDSPVQTYSSGMQARLGFATAAFLSPDIMLIDEVLAVGDVKFRMKCYDILSQKISNGCSVILVSHNEIDLMRVCGKGLYLSDGYIKSYGDISQVLIDYQSHLHLDSINAAQESIDIIQAKLNAESQSYSTGSKAVFALQINSQIPIAEARIIFQIGSQNGHLGSVSSLVSCGYISIPKGISNMCIEIERLDLVQGQYSFWVDIYGPLVRDHYCTSRALPISVSSDNYDPYGYGVCHTYAPPVKFIRGTQS